MINNSMKLKRFKEYLLERLETTPAEKLELLELGLLDSAGVVEWELDSPRYQTFDNEPMGTITYLPNWPDRETSYPYRIYPSSFGELSGEVKAITARLAVRGSDREAVLQDQVRFVWRHMPILVDKYFGLWQEIELYHCLNSNEWRATENLDSTRDK